MNDKDVFELFQNGFTAKNTFDSHCRLCDFVGAMFCGKYYSISSEAILRGWSVRKHMPKQKQRYYS